MIRGERVLAVVPARGGSKGIPRKNIRPLWGKPLLAWTLEAVANSKFIDRCVVSTEDPEIAAIAQSIGADVPFLRPKELAEDDTPGVEPVIHAIRQLPGYQWVVVLQPTSPLRTADDIDGCVSLCVERGSPACVTVTAVKTHPAWMFTLADGRLQPVLKDVSATRRQDLPPVWALNGAVYVADSKWLERSRTFLTSETVVYPMPKERSIDIDDELDWYVAEALLKKMQTVMR